jgi:hypothetical protein
LLCILRMASSVSKDLVSLLTSYLLFCSFLSYFFCLITQVLHAFATEGAHCARVREVLNSSDVSNFPLQYKLQNPMKLETIFVIMTSDSPNRKWQTNAGLKKKSFLCRYGVLTKTRSTTFSFHPMHNLLLLELLGSLRAHHQDSLTPSPHRHHNLHWSVCHLLLPLHHQLLQTLVDGILISVCSAKRNMLISTRSVNHEGTMVTVSRVRPP